MTARLDILERFKTLLLPTAGIAGRCYLSRVMALRREQLPAIVIQPASEAVTEPTNAGVDRIITVGVEFHARGDDTTETLEAIAGDAHPRLLAPGVFYDLAIDITEIGSAWTFDEGDGDAGKLVSTYAVVYRTPRDGN